MCGQTSNELKNDVLIHPIQFGLADGNAAKRSAFSNKVAQDLKRAKNVQLKA